MITANLFSSDQRKWLFVFNSNFLCMNQPHRSAAMVPQRFDHPPPVGSSGCTRRSKAYLDARNRNVCFAPSTIIATVWLVRAASVLGCVIAFAQAGSVKP